MIPTRPCAFPGATYSFTVTLRDRRMNMLTTHVDLLRSVIRDVRRQRPFAIDAAVLPTGPSAHALDPAGKAMLTSRDAGGRSRRRSVADWFAAECRSPATGVANMISGSGASGNAWSATMTISPDASITVTITR